MKKLLFFIAVLLFSCTQPKPKSSAPAVAPENLILCEGIGKVKLNYSYEDLKNNFGDSVLSEHENNISGKFTSLWEGTPQQVNIYWEEKEQPYRKIKFIEIADAASSYMTARGLRVGISLRDVVKFNGSMPVTFVNFYSKDESGKISSFNNGEIQENLPCIGGHLEMVDKRNIHSSELKRFMALKEVESFDNLLERMEVALESIRIYADKK